MLERHCATNGANIILTEGGLILCIKAAYGKKLWQIPGGGLELGEMPRQAGVRELNEETGFLMREEDLVPIATLLQKVYWEGELTNLSGFVFLYECSKFSGTLTSTADEEISDRAWMSLEEIMEKRASFGRGYIRMLIHYDRVKRGIVNAPVEARLGDSVGLRPKFAV